MATSLRKLARLVLPAGLVGAVYILVARGAVTVDLGIGRRVRPLGPMLVPIEAPRDVVFDVISSPYLGQTPHSMEAKLKVLARDQNAVLADHRTPVGLLTTSTTELVVFDRPNQVRFQLVRGPVPHVTEEFNLTEASDGRTHLEYTGEMGTDLWALGTWWGRIVARRWEATVAASLEQMRSESERRARSRKR